ncbi:hypothetical protein J2809_004205 [Arthrobacter pascens]|uniref:hypothetical protein n=1 Tax=Arthrobacter pascens TaxID=1677 RepID=UPI0028576D6C|nr:hypothetical protein [Arthrobacter pascens]MDR6559822.1 hypothetical protein [Arthrobacter pascens]
MILDANGLHKVNFSIGNAETEYDYQFFDALLASAFSMRRQDGTIESRSDFLQRLKERKRQGEPSSNRVTTMLSFSAVGAHRVLVRCIVGLDGKQYDNLRLFVRDSERSPWKLLAWANEPLEKTIDA